MQEVKKPVRKPLILLLVMVLLILILFNPYKVLQWC